MQRTKREELPIIEKVYAFILWYVPVLNRLPRDHKFLLGDRIIAELYDVLDELIRARYEVNKLARLESLNSELDVMRHQTRLLKDLSLIDAQRYGQAARQINEIGEDLGGWIKQQRAKR